MTTKKLLITLAIGTTIGFLGASCNSPATTEKEENPQMSNSAAVDERVLDKEAFAAAIKKSGAVVVDLRYPADFEQGHIEGAININFFGPEFKYKLLELNQKKKYYLYGKNETTSYRSMEFMKENGFKEVYSLKDGYEGWIKTN